MKMMAFILAHPLLYKIAGSSARFVLQYLPFLAQIKAVNPWVVSRELPKAPSNSFTTWYKKNRK
jgi:L-lactate dehydrogenase complex protein LldF